MQSLRRQALAGVLLAAGAGSRFGGGKLLHPLPDGTPIGVAAWRNLSRVLPSVTVVIRPGDPSLEHVFLDAGATLTRCPDAHLGMGHSLACGIAATAGADGWMVALADMPAVLPATIESIVQQLVLGAGIVVPVHRGRRGHPVAFSAAYRERLLALSGDSGARTILRDDADAVVCVDTDDIGVLQDIDTREDAQRLEPAPGGGL